MQTFKAFIATMGFVFIIVSAFWSISASGPTEAAPYVRQPDTVQRSDGRLPDNINGVIPGPAGTNNIINGNEMPALSVRGSGGGGSGADSFISLTAWSWYLVVINGDRVTENSGFTERKICEDAKSLYLYGRTVSQQKDFDTATARYQKAQADKFEKDHPPRPPKTKGEREAVDEAKKNHFSYVPTMGTTGGGNLGNLYTYGGEDGLIHSMPPTNMYGSTAIGPERHAYCVPV